MRYTPLVTSEEHASSDATRRAAAFWTRRKGDIVEMGKSASIALLESNLL